MILDMSPALDLFLQPVTLKRIVQTVVDYETVETATDITANAVIQPAQKEKLNPGVYNLSLSQVLYHSPDTSVNISDRLTYQGVTYKNIEGGNWTDYGYFEAVFEELK